MQDNHMDEIWREKLGGYQAPADPQDWAAMSASLDAQEQKRAGYIWWWVLGLSLLVVVGLGTYQLMLLSDSSTNGVVANNTETEQTETTNNNSTGTTTNAGNGVENSQPAHTTGDKANDNTVGSNDNPTNNDNGSDSENGLSGAPSNNSRANTNNDNEISGNGPTKNGNSSNKKGNINKSTKKNKSTNKKGTSNTSGVTGSSNNGASGTPANNVGTKGANTNNSTANTNDTNANSASIGDGGNGYDGPVGNISLKRLRKLPTNATVFSLSADTTGKFTSSGLMRPKAVSHYLGLSTGWITSRVDRSGDFRAGYNVGLQYSMMVKSRFGIHAGLAFRQYRYFTDLVACNYEIYQCPNSYSSTLQTIDLHVGAQVNLVKTDKVEWYVMGGVSNQFMLQETFEYNLPTIDTVTPGPAPVDPPTNTSFTGAGVSSFEESITQSADFTSGSILNGQDSNGQGKFLRERYLGAWYVGTGVTWHFVHRMSLQVEPVIGRSFQFVGIQDKKLWNAGVNVRLNVKLGR